MISNDATSIEGSCKGGNHTVGHAAIVCIWRWRRGDLVAIGGRSGLEVADFRSLVTQRRHRRPFTAFCIWANAV